MPELVHLLSSLGETEGQAVDWEEAERLHGTRFPVDFQDFMARYGCGSIEGQIMIWGPRPSELEPNVISEFSRGELTEANLHEGWETPELARKYPLGKMLIWGDTVGADTLCWFTGDPDPDAWPVAVFSRGSLTWFLYECGMSEFIVRILRGDLDGSPLSDESILGAGAVRFLHLKDEMAMDPYDDPWE